MKWLYAIIVTLAGLHSAHAQVITEQQGLDIAEKLYQQQILNEAGKKELVRLLKEKKTGAGLETSNDSPPEITKGDILHFCANAFVDEFIYRAAAKDKNLEAAVPHEDPLLTPTDSTAPPPLLATTRHFIHPKRSTIGYTRTRTLHELYALKLVDEGVFNEAAQQLAAQSIRDEQSLLLFLTQRNAFYTDYQFNKKEQLAYLDRLVHEGMMSDSVARQIKDSYAPLELKKTDQFIARCNNARMIDLQPYPANPDSVYPLLFNEVKQLLPAFDYSELSIRTIETPEKNGVRQDMHISFTAGGQHYQHRFFQDYRSRNTPAAREQQPVKMSPDFHIAINKYLADIASPYRVHMITVPDSSEAYGQERCGFIVLRGGQRESITNSDFILSDDSYDTTFAPKYLGALVADLRKNRFFNHLPEEEIAKGREKVDWSEINGLEDVLACFPKTIVLFDWETNNLENPYEEILRALLEASRSAFFVTSITDDFKKGSLKVKKIKFGFTLNGKRYEKLLAWQDVMLDPSFFDLVEQGLQEMQINGRFYPCLNSERQGGYIYLNDKKLRYIQQKFPDLIKE